MRGAIDWQVEEAQAESDDGRLSVMGVLHNAPVPIICSVWMSGSENEKCGEVSSAEASHVRSVLLDLLCYRLASIPFYVALLSVHTLIEA